MDKKINSMEKDASLDGQENLKTSDAAFDGTDNMSGNDDWEINIDQLLEQADMLVNNDMLPPMPEAEGENNSKWTTGGEPSAKAEQEIPAKPAQAAEPAPNAASSAGSEMDSDLDEINSLLEQADLNEKVDDDMLALLESATQNQEDEDNPDDVFDIFAEGDMPLDDMTSSDVPEQADDEEEEDTKKKSSRKKKKKKEKKAKKTKEVSDTDAKSESGEKKPGFLAKIIALFGAGEDFGEEEPDTAADENIKILNELNGDKENKSSKASKKSAKKKENKKENKKEKKGAKEAKTKTKEKKAAAPRKKKEKPVEKPAEKSVKILDGKSFTAIAGLCVSIIAGVMIVTNFIPEYVDKQNARNAFRDGDYETVYKLFYDKKLSAGEELLFNQSRVIRQMERRLEAYQNNITLGRELEAVDALMRGVENYQNLWEADEYQVRNEVDILYLQICEILNRNYGISQEQAVTIASYDKIEYTKALYAILGGNELSLQGEETEAGTGDAQQSDAELSGDESMDESSGEELLEDVLPEEEDLLN